MVADHHVNGFYRQWTQDVGDVDAATVGTNILLPYLLKTLLAGRQGKKYQRLSLQIMVKKCD